MTDQELDGTVRWAELLVETEQRLAAVDGDARVEARWLIEEATGASREDFVEVLSSLATVGGVARLDAMVERRTAGEPIQYVLGHWAFRNLDLMIDQRVLIPRPETEMLVDHVLLELDRQRVDGVGVVVDLGTGSGAIGLSIVQERPSTAVVLSDASGEAVAVARANLAGLGVLGGSVQITEGNWYEPLPIELKGSCDVIVANPPYVSTAAPLDESVRIWEPHVALYSGADGLNDLRTIVSGARPWLRDTGALVLEMDPAQITPVASLVVAEGFEVAVKTDLAGLDRVLVGRLTK